MDATPPHPYAHILEQVKQIRWNTMFKDPIQPPQPMDGTQFTIVDSKAQLDIMLSKLIYEKEIAVVSKQDMYRSFSVMNCFILIATRREDFLVDAIALKEHIKMLNDVFANINILKVMKSDPRGHLQAAGLYILNAFFVDTVAGGLHVESKTLTHLLKTFGNIDVDIKPVTGNFNSKSHREQLSDEVKGMLRGEVHYLLYLYDALNNKLIQQGAKAHKLAYKKCFTACKKVWVPLVEKFRPAAYLGKGQGAKTNELLAAATPQQWECVRLLYEWRWNTAQAKNESPSYIMPQDLLLHIAKCFHQHAGWIVYRENLVAFLKHATSESSLDVEDQRTFPDDAKYVYAQENIDEIVGLVSQVFQSHPITGTPNNMAVCFTNTTDPMVPQKRKGPNDEDGLAKKQKNDAQQMPALQ